MPLCTGLATATDLAPFTNATSSLTVASLDDRHKAEVLAFLAERPIHTVMMAGLIRDNGLVSPLNRGAFYACRDKTGRLEGVILIGEITLLEARNEATLAASARLAQDYPNAYMIIGEQEKVDRFWSYYHGTGQSPRLFCRELLFELRWPVEVREPVPGLRLAAPDDLELVMPVHAEMAFEESGINPLKVDPDGFRQRCARRIEQGRVWLWVEDRHVIFKADVISETPEAIYLEGVYVNPEERGKGLGVRCFSQLSRDLLARTKSLCLLVNEHNRAAQTLYRKSRYQFRSYYDTIFLQQQSN
jgi:ribosomal protein S18 acetylase RimI-like enzyme